MYVKHGIVRSNSRLLRVSRGVYAKRDYCRSLSTTPVSDSSASKSTDENEIYLHETRIPTYHFQDSLPKLPVPKLEDTLKQYIYFSEPMVSPEAWNATKDIVKEFASNDGLSLQQDLVNLDKKRYTTFYDDMWSNIYLEAREPLPLNYNPHLTFKDEADSRKNDQAVRASNLLFASMRFYRTLLDEKLKPDIFHTLPAKSETALYENVCRFLPRSVSFYGSYFFGAYPLDMSRYKNLFSSTRIPHLDCDEIRKTDDPELSKHIVVQRGSSFYSLQVLNDDLSLLPRDKLERGIRSILNDKPENQPPIGILTALDRNEWASARQKLETFASSKASLECIDKSLFAICLEESAPESYGEVNSTMLHGNGRNRWFDKSFQLIVAENGKSAVNFEHAWGDGISVLRYFNEVYENSTGFPVTNPCTTDIPNVISGDKDEPGVPRRLTFEVDSSVLASIDKAKSQFDDSVSRLDLATFESYDVNKQILKTKKVGADGFMQMGFQLAHYRMNGFNASTYESASTAAFKHGRTETIRPSTPEAAQFARAFGDPSVSNETRAGLMKAAINNHGTITKNCLMGKGMDRHLFALKNLAERRGMSCSVFEDETYKVLQKIIISTSTLASDALYIGGFGPVNPSCYALAYGIADAGARTSVASYGLGSQEFADHLSAAYKDMLSVL